MRRPIISIFTDDLTYKSVPVTEETLEAFMILNQKLERLRCEVKASQQATPGSYPDADLAKNLMNFEKAGLVLPTDKKAWLYDYLRKAGRIKDC